jgi:2-polyprenyl-6-methoxyphenol hydroxylase-like FAD-dependent oxidoreductase
LYLYTLATQHAGRYTLRRLALVGDAAHQVHPLGGQGVNLGIRDARFLVDALAAAAASGADVGSITALDGYSRSAAAANLPMRAALDGLQKLFAAEAPLVAWARWGPGTRCIPLDL